MNSSQPSGTVMNIGFSLNRYYLPYTIISVYSLLTDGRAGRPVRIMLAVDPELERKDLDPIFRLVSRFPGCSVQAEWPQKDSSHRFVSDASCCMSEEAVQVAYYRLFLPRLFAGEKRCLYLDSDLVICSPLAELYDMDMGCACMAGVTDRLCLEESHLKRLKADWGIEPGYYINAGVILMNLERMRSGGGAERALELAYTRPFRYLDQDVLNQVYCGQVLLLPKRYNVFPDDTAEDQQFLRELLPDDASLFPDEALISPAVVQYIGEKKPWRSSGVPYEAYWHNAGCACGALLKE